MRDYGTTNNTPAHQVPPVWRAPEGLEDLTAAQVGDGGACQHTNDKPDRSGAPRGLRGLAAVPVGDGGTSTKQKSHAIHKHKWRDITN